MARKEEKKKAASRGKLARLCVELDLTKTIFPKVFFRGALASGRVRRSAHAVFHVR